MRAIIISLLFLGGALLLKGQDNINSCNVYQIEQHWAKAGNALNASKYEEAEAYFQFVVDCSGNLQKDTTSGYFPKRYIIASTVFQAYIQLELGNYNNAKNYLDELDLNFKDPETEAFYTINYEKNINYLYARIYNKIGLFELALFHFERTIEQLLSDLGYRPGQKLNKEKVAVYFSYPALDLFNDAACIYLEFGDYDRAALYFKMALSTSEGEAEGKKQMVRQNLGRALTLAGNYTEGMKYFRIVQNNISLSNKEFSSDILGFTYKNMAENFNLNGQRDSIFYYLNKTIELDCDEKIKIHALQLYSEILIQEKDFDTAKKKLELSFKKTDRIYPEFHPERADNFRIMGDFFSATKNHKKADLNYKKALGILTGKETCSCHQLKVSDLIDKRLPLELLVRKSMNLLSLNNSTEWKTCFSFMNKLVYDLDSKYILSEESRYTLSSKSKKLYKTAIDAHLKNKNPTQAYVFCQLAKSRILDQSIRNREAMLAGGVPDSILLQERKYKRLLNEVQKSRKEAIKNDPGNLSDIENRTWVTENKYRDWIKVIEKKYPTYYELKHGIAKIKIKDIQKELKKRNHSLIEYFIFEQELYIFIINKNNIDALKVNLYDDFLKDIALVRNILRNNVYDFTTFNKFSIASHRLHQSLIAPIKEKNIILEEGMLIVPDEELFLLPFEVLTSTRHNKSEKNVAYHNLDYLLHQHSITYHYSSNLIQQKNNNRKIKLLGIAPDFNNKKIIPLPWNKKEIQLVKKIIDGHTISGYDATLTNFTEKLNSHNYLHLATHASFNENIPLASKIELADTSLFIYEIFSLNHKLDLTVISACESADGKNHKGEGLISLSKAFIQSGCKSVVANLWKVSDQKSLPIMLYFYNNIKKNDTPEMALTNSKREFLENTNTRSTHPFYWAGFIQIGWTPHPDENDLNLILILIAILFLVFISFFFLNKKKH